MTYDDDDMMMMTYDEQFENNIHTTHDLRFVFVRLTILIHQPVHEFDKIACSS